MFLLACCMSTGNSTKNFAPFPNHFLLLTMIKRNVVMIHLMNQSVAFAIFVIKGAYFVREEKATDGRNNIK